MPTQDVIIGMIIDQSGSMAPVAQDVIKGFNALIEEQRKVEGKALLSLTLFNGGGGFSLDFPPNLDVRYVARDIHEVPEMGNFGENTYRPAGGTPLLDAVGATIKGIEKWQQRHGNGEAVKIIINTDGEENTSREWHIHQPAKDEDDRDLLNLIRWKQNEGWEFVFMGAGGTQWLERTFGSVVVGQDHYMQYGNSAIGNATAYQGLSSTLTGTRTTGSAMNYSNAVLTASAATMPTTNASNATFNTTWQQTAAPVPAKRTTKKKDPKRPEA